ncbi:MAG: YaaA family protein [Muribaculaceae bacterium]|nr:YaaA family protein [Muribaculaceae bacterium]
MLILIAESKTMTACDSHVAAAGMPALESMAADVMESLKGLTAEQLAERLKLSLAMSRRMWSMIYDFDNKSTGATAIEAYTGVVFKALAYDTLSAEAQQRIGRNTRIISSLYGWLTPCDTVKAYRLDFTSRVAPGGGTLASWFRDAVTDCLLRELNERDEHDIVNMLPLDAAKCIDWKKVEARGARVWRPDFKINGTSGLRTPDAGTLKTLRGSLLRQIAEEDIDSPDKLQEGASTVSSDGTITFIID